jgi:hypothetical protein
MTKTMRVLVSQREFQSSIPDWCDCRLKKYRLRVPPPLGYDGSCGEGPSPHTHTPALVYHLAGEAWGRLSESLPHISQPADCSGTDASTTVASERLR